MRDSCSNGMSEDREGTGGVEGNGRGEGVEGKRWDGSGTVG